MAKPKGPPRVLKSHSPTGGGNCWHDEAEPLMAEAGHQIGWRCLGCKSPFALGARQIKRKYRRLTLAQISPAPPATAP